MADGISITDLEQKAEVTDNDNFAVDNGAITNKVTAKQIKDYMGPTYVKKEGDTMTGPLKLPTPAADLNDNTAITAKWVNDKIGNTGGGRIVPVGALMLGPVATMPGYILCDGRAVSRTQYAALFAAIGTNFGAGDGSNTFNVPDYRGCFLRMAGGSAGTMYQKQPQGLPDVVGSMPVNPGGKNTGAFSQSNGTSHNLYGNSSDITIFASSASNSIYGAANEVRPVNFAVNYFIKY